MQQRLPQTLRVDCGRISFHRASSTKSGIPFDAFPDTGNGDEDKRKVLTDGLWHRSVHFAVLFGTKEMYASDIPAENALQRIFRGILDNKITNWVKAKKQSN